MLAVLGIAVLVLVVALALLGLGYLGLAKRVAGLETMLRDQIAAEVKVTAALSEANALKKKVEEFEGLASMASREVAMVRDAQAQMAEQHEARNVRLGKAREVKVTMSQGW